jgi:hypothetical protein
MTGINNIVSRHSSRWQIILIVAGAFMGLLLTWLPLQLYFDINNTLSEQKDLLSNNYFIINKAVSIFNTMGIPVRGFNTDEIAELRKQPYVSQVGAFTVNRFKANVSAGVPNTDMRFSTEVFFESVPDAFIDELPSEWYWKEGSPQVPVIVPSDYLNLYNFGFASGQGLPQISASAAKFISFTINIMYNNSRVPFTGHIVGFSDRINSVLVPESFINYANEHYAIKEKPDPARMIVEVKDAAAFAKYINSKGYETNNETLRSGKISSLSRIIMQVLLILGLLITFLSLGSFIQFADLIIARAEYEIHTLNYLGYYYTEIVKIFFRYMAILIIIATVIAIAVGLVARYFLLQKFGNFFESPVSFSIEAPIILTGLISGYLLINYLNLLRHCRKLCMPKK